MPQSTCLFHIHIKQSKNYTFGIIFMHLNCSSFNALVQFDPWTITVPDTPYMVAISVVRSWRRNEMETFSALLAICAGNSTVPGEFLAQRPVTRSFDIFFDLHPNKRLSKQWWGWWFETPSCPFWRHRNEPVGCLVTRGVKQKGNINK